MSAGKGDWIPGTNDAAYHANYPTIDWDARAREARENELRKRVIDKHRDALNRLNDDPSPEGKTP